MKGGAGKWRGRSQLDCGWEMMHALKVRLIPCGALSEERWKQGENEVCRERAG